MIQKFCHDNVDFLSKNNLSYPHVTPPELHLPRYTNAAFLWNEHIWDEAEKSLKGIEQSRILISEEGLMGTPSKINIPMFEIYEKIVIIYLRKPADLVAAWAAEKCKPYNIFTEHLSDKAGIFSIERGIKQMMYDYIICMDKTIEEFKKIEDKNIIVKSYDFGSFKGGSLVHDFFSIFNIDLPIFNSASVNVSPSRKFCDISHMVFSVLKDLDVVEYFDSPIVEGVYRNCRSGDGRSVLDTLPDSTIEVICNNLNYIYDHFSICHFGGRPLFKSIFPEILHNDRHEYIPPDRSEIELLTKKFLNKRFI